MFETGAKSVIEKILPVVDNFERGIAALSDEEKEGFEKAGFTITSKVWLDEYDDVFAKANEKGYEKFTQCALNFYNLVQILAFPHLQNPRMTYHPNHH